MPGTSQFIISALYVTFVYSCMGFGALYYRTVIDRLSVKNVNLGEELYQLFDPRAFVGIGCLAFFFCIFVVILGLKTDLYHEEVNHAAPGLVFLVIPMVLIVNMIQVYLRARWQRMSVRTKGILIRRMLSERLYELRYDDHLTELTIERESLWFKVVFKDAQHQEIGSCSLSAAGLRKLIASIRSATHCVITSDDVVLDE